MPQVLFASVSFYSVSCFGDSPMPLYLAAACFFLLLDRILQNKFSTWCISSHLVRNSQWFPSGILPGSGTVITVQVLICEHVFVPLTSV